MGEFLKQVIIACLLAVSRMFHWEWKCAVSGKKGGGALNNNISFDSILSNTQRHTFFLERQEDLMIENQELVVGRDFSARFGVLSKVSENQLVWSVCVVEAHFAW